jgi:hypothetical protein
MKSPVLWLPYAYRTRVRIDGKQTDVTALGKIPVEISEISGSEAPAAVIERLTFRNDSEGFLRPTTHPDHPDGMTLDQFSDLLTAKGRPAWADYPLFDPENDLPYDPFGKDVVMIEESIHTDSPDRGIRRAAGRSLVRRLRIIDGIIWRHSAEPVLAVGPEAAGMRGNLNISLQPGINRGSCCVYFRADRLEAASACAENLAKKFNKRIPDGPTFSVPRPDLLRFDEVRGLADQVAGLLANERQRLPDLDSMGKAGGASALRRLLLLLDTYDDNAAAEPVVTSAAAVVRAAAGKNPNPIVAAAGLAWLETLTEPLLHREVEIAAATRVTAEDAEALRSIAGSPNP